MPDKPKIAIIRTGAANLASVQVAFKRLQAHPRIVETPSELSDHDLLVLPGVGSFQTGISTLRENGWESVLRSRFADNRATLAICLGLQLLCEGSIENRGVKGLEIFPLMVERLPSEVIVPQFGWNMVCSNSGFFEAGHAFYANSYCVTHPEKLIDKGWDVATSTHGIEFVAAARKGRILACQFHPELSGIYGQKLLRKWMIEALNDSSQSSNDTERLPC